MRNRTLENERITIDDCVSKIIEPLKNETSLLAQIYETIKRKYPEQATFLEECSKDCLPLPTNILENMLFIHIYNHIWNYLQIDGKSIGDIISEPKTNKKE
jgi:hypothetical protein